MTTFFLFFNIYLPDNIPAIIIKWSYFIKIRDKFYNELKISYCIFI